MISEDKMIKALQATSAGSFIGDDATILPHVNAGNRYVISKDLLIEDVHFRTSCFSPEDIAHKALHVNLSDISAMGAQALYILCGISIPSNLQDYAIRFLNSLTAMCQTASAERFFISITAIGMTPESNIKYRNGAKLAI